MRAPTFLVVEGDVHSQRLDREALTDGGGQVIEASDGKSAIDLMLARKPDLILQDLVLPDMDGFELVRRLREASPRGDTAILAMMGCLARIDETRIMAAGFDDVLVKPVEASQLRRIVGAYAPVSAPGATLALHAATARRCAELAVLRNISEALSLDVELDGALDEVMGHVLDAGGLTSAILYRAGRGLRPHAVGLCDEAGVPDFFGYAEIIDAVIQSGRPLVIPSAGLAAELADELLGCCGAGAALVVPVLHRDERLGALVMFSGQSALDDEVRIAFARTVAGQIGHALVLARAVEQHLQSEQAAKLQAATLRSVIDSIGDGVSVADETGRLILRNRSAGRVRADAVGLSLPDWPSYFAAYMPDQVTPYAAEDLPLARALRGETVEGQEVYLRGSDGDGCRWLSVNARPLIDENGVARGGVSFDRDVTVEKTVHEVTMLDRMVSIGLLASGVGHEINNPLAAVIANLDLAIRAVEGMGRRPTATGELREISAELADAREGAESIRQIVRDLRIFSRSEEEKRGPVVVERVLESALRMARNELRHRARVLRSYAKIPLVFANESRLGQLFLNLIVNAAQSIEVGNAEQNQVAVATRVDASGRAVVDISDTGSGMSPEVMRHLFTPFFTTKGPGEGTGLGLSIAQRIVADLGGEITVDSVVGKGTTFHVALPPSEVAAVPASVEREIPVAGRRGKVLVIDDEIPILSAVRRLLTPAHEVTTTTSAADGLDHLARGQTYDLILCDLMMPEMTGMVFYFELAKIAPDHLHRLVYMSGGAFTPTARAFLDEQFTPTIEKPFVTEELRGFVDNFISSHPAARPR